MKTKVDTFVVGEWYVVTNADGTQKRYKFIGGEPPVVELEGGEVVSIEAILRYHIRVEHL